VAADVQGRERPPEHLQRRSQRQVGDDEWLVRIEPRYRPLDDEDRAEVSRVVFTVVVERCLCAVTFEVMRLDVAVDHTGMPTIMRAARMDVLSRQQHQT
jgi:hypothetical protein